MMPNRTEAERDAQEAEFLLGNALYHRIFREMEAEAITRAMNAYAAMDEQQARYAMHELLAVRGFQHRVENLLRAKAERKPLGV